MEQIILFEKEICAFLSLPSIPKKEWDNKSAFKNGVAVVNTYSGQAYAVASFNPDKDSSVRITKVFSGEQFSKIEKVFVVPAYMNKDTKSFDLDAESKKNAEMLVKEAEEIENEGTSLAVPDINELPEWIFDDIKTRDEAEAWLRAYNKRNKVRGDIPKKDETIKLRLYAIYTEMNKQK